MKKLIVFLALILFITLSCYGCEEPKSNKKEILEFSVDVFSGKWPGNIAENEIIVDVPFGTDVSNVNVVAVVSDKADIQPIPTVDMDFTDPIVFTVMAEDKTWKEYTVTLNVLPNSQNDIVSFAFADIDCERIEIGENIIKVIVEYGTDISGLIPQMDVSENASINIENNQIFDFSKPVSFTVTAEDGSTKKYDVEVEIAPNSGNEILEFFVDIPDSKTVIDKENILVTVPYGSSINGIIPEIKISKMADINPGSGEKQDFTNPVAYTVIAQDGSEKSYTVKCIVAPKPKCPDNEIIEFELGVRNFLNVVFYPGIIDGNRITVTLPFVMDVKSLTMKATLSSNKARMNFANMGRLDFTDPVIITVTAQDGSTRKYTVEVNFRKSSENPLHFNGEMNRVLINHLCYFNQYI